MIALRDVSKSDKSIYEVWKNDSKLTGYLSRLCPNNSSMVDYDTSRVCWFIIEEYTRDIGSVWLEKDSSESDVVILDIFISGEKYRGKGIGSDAIKEAIRISKQRIAFRNVRLNVRKSNLRAIENVKKIWLICEQKVLKERLAGSRPFYSGASDEEAMMSKYLKRSIWHNNKILDECKATGDKYIHIAAEMGIEELLQKSISLLNG